MNQIAYAMSALIVIALIVVDRHDEKARAHYMQAQLSTEIRLQRVLNIMQYDLIAMEEAGHGKMKVIAQCRLSGNEADLLSLGHGSVVYHPQRQSVWTEDGPLIEGTFSKKVIEAAKKNR